MKVSELFSHWTEIRHELLRALDLLSDEQLNFVPREGLWSLGTVVRHIAEAELGWYQCILTGKLKEWPASFTAEDYPTVEAVKALLAEVHAQSEAYLDTLELDDLTRDVKNPWTSETMSQQWVIWHVIDHETHHRGEVFLMLGLMGIQGPDI